MALISCCEQITANLKQRPLMNTEFCGLEVLGFSSAFYVGPHRGSVGFSMGLRGRIHCQGRPAEPVPCCWTSPRPCRVFPVLGPDCRWPLPPPSKQGRSFGDFLCFEFLWLLLPDLKGFKEPPFSHKQAVTMGTTPTTRL